MINEINKNIKVMYDIKYPWKSYSIKDSKLIHYLRFIMILIFFILIIIFIYKLIKYPDQINTFLSNIKNFIF